jgi:hypothetical protein
VPYQFCFSVSAGIKTSPFNWPENAAEMTIGRQIQSESLIQRDFPPLLKHHD